jgi:hypothetical protein
MPETQFLAKGVHLTDRWLIGEGPTARTVECPSDLLLPKPSSANTVDRSRTCSWDEALVATQRAQRFCQF